MIDKEKALDVMRSAVKQSDADLTEIGFGDYSLFLSRFAKSEIHQNVGERNSLYVARVVVDGRIGVSLVNGFGEDQAKLAVSRAIEIAKASEKEEIEPAMPGPQTYGSAKTYYDSTAGFSAENRAAAVSTVVGKANEIDAEAGGAVSSSFGTSAIVNSNGLEAFAPSSVASLTAMISAGSASGSASTFSPDAGTLDVQGVADEAADICSRSANPVDLEPGKYDVILKPKAIAEILDWLCWTSFGAKSIHDGRSFMTGKIGEKVMGENISIWDDAQNPAGRPFPFDSEGVARKKVMLVENGVAAGPVYDTLTAAKDKKESTGHASSPVYAGGPYAQNLFVAPGDSNLDDMIKSVKKGLLITRFHYVNGLLDTRKALFTGMTRDGSFLIEDGKVGRPVKNLRFTQNMLEAFSNVEAMTEEVGGIQAIWGDGAFVVPSMLISGFTFTGSTEF